MVAVDIRPGSPTLGRYEAIVANDENHLALWAPWTFARGFCVLSAVVDLEYLTTGTYGPGAESGIAWDDPDIGIDWPTAAPLLSDKDRVAQSLSEWLTRPEAERFRVGVG